MSELAATSATLLSGRIKNYRKSRKTGEFLIKRADREKTGVAAVGSAALGLSGEALALMSMGDVQEEADFVEFDLNGEKVEGWLAWSPFKEGDKVDVLVERTTSGDWNAFGIVRDDRVVALYPHCSRGRFAHYRSALWIGFKITFFIIFFMTILTMVISALHGSFFKDGFIYSFVFLGGGFFCLILTSLVSILVARKFLPFVYLAERIFTNFGWKDVRNIDLPKLSGRNKQPGDSFGMGRLYFRY